MTQDDWRAAVAAALALADIQLQPAAELFAQMMGRLQTSDRSISPAAQGISVLHKAECYADVSKVGMLALADIQLQPAAELFAQMMSRLQTSDRSILLAAHGISVLHQAKCYPHASKVVTLAFCPC